MHTGSDFCELLKNLRELRRYLLMSNCGYCRLEPVPHLLIHAVHRQLPEIRGGTIDKHTNGAANGQL